ncbi:glycosyltransferase family 2 protein [Oleiharenicola lentus]|uniref:Glycosyltransferase family 2 protein n=1 Tax=Oleiharenicola lentus TaxID=2508720 RepID=A0A4Q1C3R5_9BACT|nr:glycosyltransferase family 2 protein [Oleiharenicola lentus]RXK52913.1 glycosyltransferase family 2 protein [Oleiharenicola lentus]
MSSPDVSIIIVNWNSKDYLRACLQSLGRHHPPGLKLEIIVVDGASFDGCDRMLAAEFPEVRFIQSRENIGFARANNLGARHAGGRNLLLLNPDTEFIEDSLSLLGARLESLPKAGAVGCRLLNTDRSLQTTSILNFPTILNRVLDSEYLRRRYPDSSLWGNAALFRQGTTPVAVEALSGACILIRKDCFDLIGGFTESYFMYGEDVDLGYKLRKAGWLAYYIPEAQLVHHGGGSSRQTVSNFSTVMMRVSCHHFMRLHRGLAAATAYRIAMGGSALLRLLLIIPLLPFGNQFVRHGRASLGKWLAVLRWSVGGKPGRT